MLFSLRGYADWEFPKIQKKLQSGKKPYFFRNFQRDKKLFVKVLCGIVSKISADKSPNKPAL